MTAGLSGQRVFLLKGSPKLRNFFELVLGLRLRERAQMIGILSNFSHRSAVSKCEISKQKTVIFLEFFETFYFCDSICIF